jgi:hypothetical protein
MKQAKGLSQANMYAIWDTMEDILMFIEGGEYSLPDIVNLRPGNRQPTEELRQWADILEKHYLTDETKKRYGHSRPYDELQGDYW